MRIGIDTAPISQHPARGVGALGGQLLDALLRAGAPHDFVLFAHAGSPRPRAGAAAVERVERPPAAAGFSPAWLLDAWRLDRQVRRRPLDVFHAYFQWNLPLRRLPLPVVGHVYDLMPMAVAEVYTRRYGLRVGRRIGLYARYLRRALRRVDRVIAISERTREDLARWTGFPADRVRVVYPGPAPGMRPPTMPRAAGWRRERLGLRGEYLLYVGGYDYRKNVETILEAHAQARRRGMDLPLVLAGGMGSPYGQRIAARLKEAGRGAGLVALGHVPGGDLPALYAGARLVLYPSWYEGFGLPVLDAMACGAAVACARTASLPEVAGEAALLLPPDDAAAWAEAICRVAGDDVLRGVLRERSLARAGGFSWERAARETIAVYEELAGGA